jgi:hypothetical protein
MKFIRFALGSILFVACFGTASMAQNNRTFVSGAGLDTNPCSLTSPCRTFGQAISVTNAGGEVVALTSAGYGPFMINKSVTVDAPAGVYAGITAPSSGGLATGDGIDIITGGLFVVLRGLTVSSQNSDPISGGIVAPYGGTLKIENCVINGFTNSMTQQSPNAAGISFAGSGPGFSGGGTLTVKDTIVRANDFGIVAVPGSVGGNAGIILDHVTLEYNGTGLRMLTGAAGTVTGSIYNSTVSINSNGISLEGSGTGGVALNIESCLIGANHYGVLVSADLGGGASAIISNCVISLNSVTYQITGTPSFLYSRGNNTINSLAGGSLGTLTPLAAQ